MKFQGCAEGFEILEKIPDDPQSDMMLRQVAFQSLVGTWDDRLKDFGGRTYCLPMTVLHNLDMASQECSEAWDMVEGGWKQHKTQPTRADPAELFMELIDVAHFIFNAYLFMGGQPEKELVAAAVGRSKQELRLPEIGLDEAWHLASRSYERNGGRIEALYGYGSRSHGQAWEKAVATRINYLRHKIMKAADTIRLGLGRLSVEERTPQKFPPSSGYIYIELMPWVYGAAQAIPDCDAQAFYSAFCHKNAINFERQDQGY